MPGHAVDANTLALWRFDEETVPASDLSSAADEKGLNDWSQSSSSVKPRITQGPGVDGVDFARIFNAALSQMMTSPGNATSQTAFLGSFTMECWIYLEDLSSEHTILSYGASGETQETNVLLQWKVSASGFQDMFWEHDAGVNESFVQSAGDTVPTDAWTHLAVKFVRSGSNFTITVYLNGVAQETSGSIVASDGGSTSSWSLGDAVGGDALFGRISDMRFSDIARSDTEILASAQASDFRHTDDADTVSLWHFDEPPELLDISGNGYHLNPSGGVVPTGLRAASLQGDGEGFGRTTDNTLDGILDQPRARSSEWSPFFTGAAEWTIEFMALWGRPDGNGHIIGLGGTGETESNNALALIDLNSDGTFGTFWEFGSGVNVLGVTPSPVLPPGDPDRYKPTHFAIVKSSNGDGTSDVLVYKDGVLSETISSLTDPSGGTDIQLFLLGDSAGGDPWHGIVDDMRVSTVARTATEIADSAALLAQAGGATQFFKMRGIDQTCPSNQQPAYVYWIVQDEPDLDASELNALDLICGSDPSTDVVDIEVAHTWVGS